VSRVLLQLLQEKSFTTFVVEEERLNLNLTRNSTS